jgi:RNA polymerase sigma factor (sigma-70 family)
MGKPLEIASDEALVISAKGGMHLAYVELCRRHSPSTFRMIHRITRSKEDAEDVLQESLLKAFIHLNSLDEMSKFSTWLTRIAINSAQTVLPKRRTRSESSFGVDLLSHLSNSNSALDPERHFLEREREFRLRKAIRCLPPLLREATEIRYLEEVPVSTVAAQTRASLGATKSRLLRARRLLRRALVKMACSTEVCNKLERTRRTWL